MEISNPRRILAVSSPGSGILELIKGLTGTTATTLAADTIAGTTHTWPIKTSYYTASIPIWLDEISDPAAWSNEFLTPEAKEVLSALGAFIVCFRKPVSGDDFREVKKLLECVGSVVKQGCGLMWEGACLAVAMPQSMTPCLQMSFDEWEEVCQDCGFEFVDFESKGRNEFSEPTGLDRLREALETNEWEGSDELDPAMNFDDLDGEDDDDEEGSIGFGIDRDEMAEEMAGMKHDIYAGGLLDRAGQDEGQDEDDEEVEKLQAMMLKMQAVRDMGADLPEAERKRLAAKTVNEIMKTL